VTEQTDKLAGAAELKQRWHDSGGCGKLPNTYSWQMTREKLCRNFEMSSDPAADPGTVRREWSNSQEMILSNCCNSRVFLPKLKSLKLLISSKPFVKKFWSQKQLRRGGTRPPAPSGELSARYQ